MTLVTYEKSDCLFYYACTQLHICSKDKETEEYLDELKGLAESMSDDNDVTNVDMLSEEMKVMINVEKSADASVSTIRWSENTPHL
ncbi:hypothetical protein T4C_4995 [Trichinella pseudospiralis]|uniref:Uncharacterized protein n=2 Tax=Trichinella pseudospiralis TaxID=6337 RepID=A0A0V1GKA6_TRIPS|nr:hypothetical protein T4C_4995 [Trichinella pseudospiralis]